VEFGVELGKGVVEGAAGGGGGLREVGNPAGPVGGAVDPSPDGPLSLGSSVGWAPSSSLSSPLSSPLSSSPSSQLTCRGLNLVKYAS
jgi:hypothetical protein